MAVRKIPLHARLMHDPQSRDFTRWIFSAAGPPARRARLDARKNKPETAPASWRHGCSPAPYMHSLLWHAHTTAALWAVVGGVSHSAALVCATSDKSNEKRPLRYDGTLIPTSSCHRLLYLLHG